MRNHNNNNNNNNNNQVEERFSKFYERWVSQLEENLQQLIHVSKNPPLNNPQEIEALVSKLTTQHKEYYTTKWAAAHEDVLAFFTPVWLTPLENAYLWLTGWKPSMAFRLIDSLRHPPPTSTATSLEVMSEEQMKKIEELRVKIKFEEGQVEREMERQQVAVGDRRMVELARLTSRVNDGDVAAVTVLVSRMDGLVEVALKSLLGGLERLMKAADCVRLKTLKGVLDILSPLQCVEFLAADSMIHIQLGKWGKIRTQKQQQLLPQ